MKPGTEVIVSRIKTFEGTLTNVQARVLRVEDDEAVVRYYAPEQGEFHDHYVPLSDCEETN